MFCGFSLGYTVSHHVVNIWGDEGMNLSDCLLSCEDYPWLLLHRPSDVYSYAMCGRDLYIQLRERYSKLFTYSCVFFYYTSIRHHMRTLSYHLFKFQFYVNEEVKLNTSSSKNESLLRGLRCLLASTDCER
jgi:hypothetical protein